MADTIQFRRDTTANVTSADPVLRAGEPFYDSTTGYLYLGDGATAWSGLTAIQPGAGGGGGTGDVVGPASATDNAAVRFNLTTGKLVQDSGLIIPDGLSCTISTFGASVLDDANASAARTTLGVVIGTDVQAYDADLAAIAGLTSAADSFPYFTGSGTAALLVIGSAVRTFLATPSSANLASAVSDETGTGSLVFANTPTLVTPVLGTPTSGTLTNCTGLPISTGVSGLGTGVATFLATPSSANLASAITDETGSSKLVFSTAPTFDSTITVGTASGTTGAVLLNGTTSGTVTFTVASAAGTHTIKLPTADGSANQVLKTDGSGQWGWVGISQTKARSLTVVFDGQGTAISGSTKGRPIRIPYAGTITKWTLSGSVSGVAATGSAVCDIWKASFSTSTLPTVANTITASAKPTITSAGAAESSTLTGWTTSVTAGDQIIVNVDSNSTFTELVLVLEITTST